MHDPLRTDDPSAIELRDGLMAKAHSEYWNDSFEVSYGIEGDSRVVRSSGAGAENEPFGSEVTDSLWRNFIIPKNTDFGPKSFQVLNEVIGKGIVVIDEHDHARHSPMKSPFRSCNRVRGKIF